MKRDGHRKPLRHHADGPGGRSRVRGAGRKDRLVDLEHADPGRRERPGLRGEDPGEVEGKLLFVPVDVGVEVERVRERGRPGQDSLDVRSLRPGVADVLDRDGDAPAARSGR